MATLNTLRTRFGFVLTGVIALVLLAFIFSPSDFMSFSGNDPVVATINGHDVRYSEYAREYDNVMEQSGLEQLDDQQSDMIYNSTWQSLVANHVVMPGLAQMGITFGNSEYSATIRGVLPTQTMYSAFGNQQTGGYDVEALNNFVMSSRGNEQAEAAWSNLVDQAADERVTTKYMALVMQGLNVNSLEASMLSDGENRTVSGRWAAKHYSDIDDELVSVSDAEVKAVYDSRKEIYKRLPTRTVSYAVFNVAPSAEDLTAIESKANKLASDLAASSLSDIGRLLRENRIGSVAANYVGGSQLPSAEAATLIAGGVYGPRITGDAWRISRVVESIYASDTLSLRHIVLPYNEEALADSLYNVLKNGGDFAAAAAQYSQFSESAQNGGDVGAVPFATFDNDFAQALASARKGDIVKVAVGDMIQIIEVYGATPRTKHYKVATVDVPIVASEASRLAAHSAAGEFAVAADENSDEFMSLAAEASVSPYTTSLNSASRAIDAVDGSLDVARWAHKSKVGEVSEIFSVSDGYLVAVVTNINDSKYESLESVGDIIRLELTNDKKYEYIKSQVSGSTFDEMAASIDAATGDFDDVNFNSYYVAGIGVEPAAIGAISAVENEGDITAPVACNSGVYFFEATDVINSANPLSADDARLSQESTLQQTSQQMLFGVLESMGEVEDLRGAVL